jgi:hypothetical protein
MVKYLLVLYGFYLLVGYGKEGWSVINQRVEKGVEIRVTDQGD